MSYVVANAFHEFYDDQNSSSAFYDDEVYTIHTELNEINEFEDGGAGPWVKTFVIEQDDDKIDDKRKELGVSSEHVNLESGVITFQVFVQSGLGDEDSMADTKVVDNIKKVFRGGYLETDDGSYIKFGNAMKRQPVNVGPNGPIQGGDNTFQWRRSDLLISYFYTATE